jgi:tRNA uridine 5-carbamoylmethylation protein Kti12
MLDDNEYTPGITEPRIIMARDTLIAFFLCDAVSVICDDTNLPQRTVDDLKKIADLCGAGFQVMDLTGVPLQVCLDRNATRTDKQPVPEDWIRKMHSRHLVPSAGSLSADVV